MRFVASSRISTAAVNVPEGVVGFAVSVNAVPWNSWLATCRSGRAIGPNRNLREKVGVWTESRKVT